MADQLHILDSYIQMREGNNLREQADLALIKQLREDYEAEHERRLKAEARIAELEKRIELMQSAQPITNNYNIQRDFIDKQVVGL